jgi:hypothetical protein
MRPQTRILQPLAIILKFSQFDLRQIWLEVHTLDFHRDLLFHLKSNERVHNPRNAILRLSGGMEFKILLGS